MAKKDEASATMTATTPSTPEEVLNRLPHISEHPELRALEAKLAQLNVRLAGNELKERELGANVLALRSATAESQFADALINDPAATRDDSSSLSQAAEAEGLQRENSALKRAIRNMHDTGSMTSIEHVKAELCGAACRQVQPLHRMNSRRVVNGMLTLIDAQQQQQHLHEQLNAKGYYQTSHLTNFYVTDFGRLDDSGSWISAMLRDAVQVGQISEAERVAISRGELRQVDLNA